MLVNHYWPWGLPWSVVDIPVNSTGASWLLLSQWVLTAHSFFIRGRTLFPRPTQGWYPSWLETVQGCTYCPSIWEFMCINSAVSGRLCFCGAICHLALIIFQPSLPRGCLCPVGRGLMKISCLGLRALQPLTFCTLSTCGSLCSFWSAARKSFSDEGWARHRSECSH